MVRLSLFPVWVCFQFLGPPMCWLLEDSDCSRESCIISVLLGSLMNNKYFRLGINSLLNIELKASGKILEKKNLDFFFQKAIFTSNFQTVSCTYIKLNEYSYANLKVNITKSELTIFFLENVVYEFKYFSLYLLSSSKWIWGGKGKYEQNHIFFSKIKINFFFRLNCRTTYHIRWADIHHLKGKKLTFTNYSSLKCLKSWRIKKSSSQTAKWNRVLNKAPPMAKHVSFCLKR